MILRLSQIIFKIISNLVVKMYCIGATNIVLGAGVRHVIDCVYVVFHTLTHETQRVLPYHYGVNRALADEQFALE